MELSKQEYQKFVQARAKPSPLAKDCALATRLLPTVSRDYEQTVTAIQSFQGS